MISVIVGTFGDPSWLNIRRPAIESVLEQTVQPVSIHALHTESLQTARNTGGFAASGEWLCFLDADDRLDRYYLEKMIEAIERNENRDVLIQPSHVNSISAPDGEAGVPSFHPPRNLRTGNHLLIGTLVKAEVFRAVGGFRDLPMYEDWDLWIRCVAQGSEIAAQPDAHYLVTVQNGRNSQPVDLQIRVSREILDFNFNKVS